MLSSAGSSAGEISETVRKFAKEGAAEGVKEVLAAGSSVPALKQAEATPELRLSTNTLAFFITPFLAALRAPLKINTCENSPLLEAAFQIFTADYPDNKGTRANFCGGCACLRACKK